MRKQLLLGYKNSKARKDHKCSVFTSSYKLNPEVSLSNNFHYPQDYKFTLNYDNSQKHRQTRFHKANITKRRIAKLLIDRSRLTCDNVSSYSLNEIDARNSPQPQKLNIQALEREKLKETIDSDIELEEISDISERITTDSARDPPPDLRRAENNPRLSSTSVVAPDLDLDKPFLEKIILQEIPRLVVPPIFTQPEPECFSLPGSWPAPAISIPEVKPVEKKDNNLVLEHLTSASSLSFPQFSSILPFESLSKFTNQESKDLTTTEPQDWAQFKQNIASSVFLFLVYETIVLLFPPEFTKWPGRLGNFPAIYLVLFQAINLLSPFIGLWGFEASTVGFYYAVLVIIRVKSCLSVSAQKKTKLLDTTTTSTPVAPGFLFKSELEQEVKKEVSIKPKVTAPLIKPLNFNYLATPQIKPSPLESFLANNHYTPIKPVYPHSILAALGPLASWQYFMPKETEILFHLNSFSSFIVRNWISSRLLRPLVQALSQQTIKLKHLPHLLPTEPIVDFTNLPSKSPDPNFPLNLAELYAIQPELAKQRLIMERILDFGTPVNKVQRQELIDRIKRLEASGNISAFKGDYGQKTVPLDNTITEIWGDGLSDTQLLLHIVLNYFDSKLLSPYEDSKPFSHYHYSAYGKTPVVSRGPYLLQLSPGRSHLVVADPIRRKVYDIYRGDDNLFFGLATLVAHLYVSLPQEHLLRSNVGFCELIEQLNLPPAASFELN